MSVAAVPSYMRCRGEGITYRSGYPPLPPSRRLVSSRGALVFEVLQTMMMLVMNTVMCS